MTSPNNPDGTWRNKTVSGEEIVPEERYGIPKIACGAAFLFINQMLILLSSYAASVFAQQPD